MIHSADAGSVMVIPREKGLVRLYIQLNEVKKEAGSMERSEVGPETILESAQKILSPYQLKYDYCDWWTVYQVRHITFSFVVVLIYFIIDRSTHRQSV